jgi:hypothetical protein
VKKSTYVAFEIIILPADLALSQVKLPKGIRFVFALTAIGALAWFA